jgi:peptidoglycan glycosyltransferase
MKEMRRNIRLVGTLLLALFIGAGAVFGFTVYSQGSRWQASQYNTRMASMKNKMAMGTITDRNGDTLAYTTADGERRYMSGEAARRALSQTVGDPKSMSGTGVETFHAGSLLGFSGSVLDRMWQWFRGEAPRGYDIQLTVDASLTAYISQQFPAASGSGSSKSYYRGAAVVINYKTGEILAMVSRPNYDPDKLSTRRTDPEDTSYLNRCLQGQYTPGSIFKVVTLCAALNSMDGVTARRFNCYGERVFGNNAVRCPRGDAHGELTLEQAFAKSCNVTFASLAYEMGEDRLVRTARELGFNTDFLFQDIILYASKIPDDMASESELAWSGVGQGKIQVTPMHMAMLAGAVANGGLMMEPRLIAQVTGSAPIPKPATASRAFMRAMSEDTADKIKGYMLETVRSGTAAGAAVSGYKICGKTGTAEVSDDKSVPTDAWFIGFVDSEEYPFAVAVVVERGGSGSVTAAGLAATALRKTIELY